MRNHRCYAVVLLQLQGGAEKHSSTVGQRLHTGSL